MNYLDPSMLDEFNRNALSNEDLKKIESELLQNKVANASLSVLFQEYHTRTDIDDLIGADEEDSIALKEIEKKIAEKCENFAGSVSVESNLKIQQSMNNLKVSKEEMAKVAERCKAINASYESSKTLKENLVAFYKAEHPDFSETEATEVINKLLKGCDELTQQYHRAIAEGFNAEEEIQSLTSEMDTETRFNYLVNALAAVDALNSSTFASKKDANETISSLIDKYRNDNPNPTESDCNELQSLLAQELTNNTLLLSGMEQAKTLLASAHDANSVIDFASEQYDDSRAKAEKALAMWLEYEKGNLSSIEAGATPESIGIGAATAVEEAKIMNDVVSGRTTIDTAIYCLKVLGGIALCLLLGYLGLVAAAAISGFAAVALVSVFGTSTIACVATSIVCLPLIWGLAELGVDAGAYILNKAGKVFDFVVEKLRETVIPKFKEITSSIVAWFKQKLSGEQSSSETIVAMS